MKYIWPSLLVLLLALLAAVYFQYFQPKPLPEPVKPSFKLEIFENRTEIIVWTATSQYAAVTSVFDGIGRAVRKLNHTVTKESDADNNWDVMWTHEYFFDKFVDKFRTMKLKQHQMINHMPSITFLTNKLHMSVSTTSKYIPSSFNFPALKNEFLYFAKIYPKHHFLVKNMDKGGIEMVQFEKVNINMGSFRYLQSYVNPRLIYGHAFDIGVYVLITSMDPLRIYRWNQDILVRFCSEKFLPFDSKIPEKFNCAINSKNLWDIPQLAEQLPATNMEIVMKALSPDKPLNINEQINDAIATTALEKNLISQRYSKLYVNRTKNQLRHFFELLRFDFLVDNDFDMYLLEINMSPEMEYLESRNDEMCQSVLRDTLKIVGAENYEDYNATRTFQTDAETNALIDLYHCKDCKESCDQDHCDLCLRCMPNDLQELIYQVYREHQRKSQFKRIFPAKKYHDQESREKMTENTRKVSDWVNIKCDQDDTWC